MSAQISVEKVSVENLPLATQGLPDLFRVVFRAGTAVARTPSKRANPDGSVEWTQPLEIVVYDTSAKLVAVVQQFNFQRGWILGPDRHFEGTSITALPTKWIHSPDLPSAPKFYAELRVDIEPDESHGNQYPSLGGTDGSDEDYCGLPMLCSPRVLHQCARSHHSNDGKVESTSPMSVATTPPTLMTTSEAGGFFGDGSRIGVYSEERSPGSSVQSQSPQLPPPVNHTTAPPPYDEVLRERGTLGTAAGAVGVVAPLHPEMAVSRSFSWSPPLSSSVASSVSRQHQGGVAETGDEGPPILEKLRPFSRLPLISAASLPQDAAAPREQRGAHEAAVGAATSPRLSPQFPAAQKKGGRGTATTKPNTPENADLEYGQSEQATPSTLRIAAPGKQDKTEASLVQTLLAEESRRGPTHIRVAVALNKLGLHVRDSGRPGEAEGFLRRALEIQKGCLDSDDLQSAWTLHELGVCVRGAGRPREAEKVLKRALQIKEARVGPDDDSVALTLHELGLCVREAGRPDEAEEIFKRALRIKEVKVGRDTKSVGLTLHELARCVREAGRPEEAEALLSLLKTALEIREASLGADDVAVALTLHGLGLRVRQQQPGRLEEDEESLGQALQTKETKLGPGHPQVAATLHELGRCAREAGRPKEAKKHLQQALAIQEDQPGIDDLGIAWTLHEMALCAREVGRIGEAEDMFRQALCTKTTKLGPDDLQGAVTLYELGRCARAAGCLGEAEERFKQALKIVEVNLGPDDIQIAWTLQELGRCVREAGRPREAEEFLKRALRIQEAKLGPSHASIPWTMHDLARCAETPEPVGGVGDIVKHVDELLKYLRRRMRKFREDDVGVADGNSRQSY